MNIPTRVLGLLHSSEREDFSVKNKHSKHIKSRSGRGKLVLPEARPLYFFETFRIIDSTRQVHCLLEDATLLIFNKENKMLITFIIADEGLLDIYLGMTDDIGPGEHEVLYKCARLNMKTKATKIKDDLGDFDLDNYLESKRKYLTS